MELARVVARILMHRFDSERLPKQRRHTERDFNSLLYCAFKKSPLIGFGTSLSVGSEKEKVRLWRLKQSASMDAFAREAPHTYVPTLEDGGNDSEEDNDADNSECSDGYDIGGGPDPESPAPKRTRLDAGVVTPAANGHPAAAGAGATAGP